MFQKHGVTGQKCRSSKAKNLPKRIIPGHNGQYGSQRLKTHIRPAVFCGDLHRPQKGRAILSIIATDPGTLFQLGTGLLQRLTHLQRHRKSQTLLLLFQLLRQSLQQIHPFFNTAAPPLVPEGLCIVERLIHSSPLPFFITAHHLTRSRVNRLQQHSCLLSINLLSHLAHTLGGHHGIKVQQFYTMMATQSVRSEEHTSELQSRPHLVCRLLLEKKKQKKKKNKIKKTNI